MPELLFLCRVNPSFEVNEQLQSKIKTILQSSVKSHNFQRMGIVLLRRDKSPVWWYYNYNNSNINSDLDIKRWQDYFNKLTDPSYLEQKNLLDPLKPAAHTTLPVILYAGDPMGTMEVGIFNIDTETARSILGKAVSLARHMADIIQESSFFNQKKYTHLRKLAMWLEMMNTISSTMDLGQVLHVVTQLTADMFSAKNCIYLLNQSDKTLIPEIAVESYDPIFKNFFSSLHGQRPFPAITKTIETQRPVLVTEKNIKMLLPSDILEKLSFGPMLFAPITNKGTTIGIMQIDRPPGDAEFDHVETEIIFGITRATAIAMENAKLIEKLSQKEQVLHNLLNKLISAQEKERKRIASELHDGILQSIIGIWYRLQQITSKDYTDLASWHQEISNLTNNLSEHIQDMRRILHDLRPIILDNYGLVPALNYYAKSFQENHNLPVELYVDVRIELSSHIEITLFRIFQEALTNVLKHANASCVKVELFATENDIELLIQDDGSGLDSELLSLPDYKNRLGLADMQERAHLLGGTCNIDSGPNKGMRILVQIPVNS